MTNELLGKVALVTGASGGIGLALAQRFVMEGARVVLADIDPERGEAAATDLGEAAAFVRTDVADQSQVRGMVQFAVERFGGLQVLVNNAGISGARHGTLLDDDFSDFDLVLRVNLLGTMAGTREAARHMAAHGGGSVINISSIGGLQPAPSMWAYHASKTAVIHFTQSAAIGLGTHDIRVNCIAPGNIETSILEGALAAHVPPEERAELMAKVREFILSRQPLHRQGRTDDIAEAALFFASDRSAYVTGTVLPVDGGLLAGNPSTTGGLDALRKATKA
jgi:NAD(P)-dependent dehydrogenase (short-subunit alcohol dehydrogenase family)